MQVILTKNVDNLGYTDDLVTVKPGYARNYLIPQGMAIVANDTNKRILAAKDRQREKKVAAMLEQIKQIKEQLEAKTIKVGAKVGTTEKIFGSVTTHHLSEAIKEQTGVDVDRRKIEIVEGDVKTLGTYTAAIDLHKDHPINVSFEVVAE